MFEHLTRFDKIIVTGPQRSGTRICAKMIAADTGHAFVGEEGVHVDSLNALVARLADGGKKVFQCPALCRYAHQMPDDDIAVVMMIRPVDEIIASQERIGWDGERVEQLRYGMALGAIAEIKYDYWHSVNKLWIDLQGWAENCFEISYHDLESHPLWVPKAQRANFTAWQTE